MVTDPSGANPFWDFSLEVYARPGVAEACLDLQDRRGVDVNLLLFALWSGAVCGVRLTPDVLASLNAAVAGWRAEVVEPLRQARRRAKAEPGGEVVYAQIKAAELAAERLVQDRLHACAGLAAGRADPPAAMANMVLLAPGDGAILHRILSAAVD